MRPIARIGWLIALTATTAVASPALAQATKPAAQPAAAAPSDTSTQVLATVNKEPITRGEVVNFLKRYRIPEDNLEQVYQDAIDTLVNTHLINQYLARQLIKVPEEKVNEAIATLEKQLKQDGSDLATELINSKMSMAEVRQEYANRIRWVEFVNTKATEAELKRFESTHKDLFNGTQVKASHILLKLDPKASAADKEKVRQKLMGLKQDIEAKKTTFAEAANKHSEDPANTEGAGGDVGYFGLNSGFIEEFANAAFALPKGSISDPVETPYGLHLILITDRKDGAPFDFEQNKPLVKQLYAADLQKTILSAARKTAAIEVKPMPADLFKAAEPAPAPATGATAKPATPK